MNFDQKAVKFLANFYMNEGKHWTHGPMRPKSVPTQPVSTVLLSRPRLGVVWDQMCPPAGQQFPAGLRMSVGYLQESPRTFTRNMKELWLERRPPMVTDLDIPGPAKYKVPNASVRESSPHPHFSISRKHLAREGNVHRAWPTVRLQRESPFTPKANGNQEQKWPSPADHGPLSPPAFPAVSFGGCRPAPKTVEARTRPGLPRAWGACRRAQPPLQRPSPNIYDILPGSRLRSPRPPSFSLSRAPAVASWLSSSRNPGPGAYYVKDCYNSRFPSAPGVVIQGVRRPKRHDTGPFCTL